MSAIGLGRGYCSRLGRPSSCLRVGTYSRNHWILFAMKDKRRAFDRCEMLLDEVAYRQKGGGAYTGCRVLSRYSSFRLSMEGRDE